MNLNEILPEAIKKPAKKMRDIAYILAYRGTDRFCPVCEKTSVKFAAAGSIPRKEAKCIHCGALERHRFVWEFFKDKTNLFDGNKKSMLHVAPEPFLEKRLNKYLGEGYLSADLYDKKAMVKMDLTDIHYPGE